MKLFWYFTILFSGISFKIGAMGIALPQRRSQPTLTMQPGLSEISPTQRARTSFAAARGAFRPEAREQLVREGTERAHRLLNQTAVRLFDIQNTINVAGAPSFYNKMDIRNKLPKVTQEKSIHDIENELMRKFERPGGLEYANIFEFLEHEAQKANDVLNQANTILEETGKQTRIWQFNLGKQQAGLTQLRQLIEQSANYPVILKNIRFPNWYMGLRITEKPVYSGTYQGLQAREQTVLDKFAIIMGTWSNPVGMKIPSLTDIIDEYGLSGKPFAQFINQKINDTLTQLNTEIANLTQQSMLIKREWAQRLPEEQENFLAESKMRKQLNALQEKGEAIIDLQLKLMDLKKQAIKLEELEIEQLD